MQLRSTCIELSASLINCIYVQTSATQHFRGTIRHRYRIGSDFCHVSLGDKYPLG